MKYYGHKIPYDWHRLYQSYTGVFCENYFPEILFSTLLEPYTNPYHIAEFLDDKNLLPVLFRGIDGYISRPLMFLLLKVGYKMDRGVCFLKIKPSLYYLI